MAWPDPVERVSAVLRAAAVEARIEEFTDGTPTARDAAKAVGCDLSQIVKSLVFVCDGAFVLALVPGDRRADEVAIAAAVPAKTGDGKTAIPFGPLAGHAIPFSSTHCRPFHTASR